MYEYIPTQYDDYIDLVHNDFGYTVDEVKKNNALNELWKNLDETLILILKNKFNISHIIREKNLPLNFKIIYSNEHFYVYDIK